jgi:general stress protein 26
MNGTDAQQIVWTHIAKIGTCMMVARDGDLVRARPMRGIAKPHNNEIWFLADRSSSIGDEFSDDPQCCLTYCDSHAQAYVSVSGQMQLVQDKAAIADWWSDEAAAYFPRGPDDPSVLLLRFSAEIAQYWEAPSSPILLAISFLQAKFQGQRPSLGSSGTATFS